MLNRQNFMQLSISLIRLNRYVSLGICLFFMSIYGLAAQTLADLYPEIDGWKRSDKIKIFIPENLHRYIDGAADAFLMQDFECLTVAYYTRSDTSVTVEIYRHRTESHAYGIYSQERTSSVEYLPIGIQGYYAETILNFVIGRNYVKLTSINLGTCDKEILTTIAQAVTEKLGGSTTPPPLISCFPKKGLIPNSEHFIGENFLGYSFFPPAYIADYQFDSLSFQLFIIKHSFPDEYKNWWMEYLKYLKTTPRQLSDSEMIVDDPNHGTIIFNFEEKTIWGTIGRVPSTFFNSLYDTFHNCIHQ